MKLWFVTMPYCDTILAVGNKKDLESVREVPFNVAQEFAEYNHMIDALETSAKENSNIDTAFLKMAKVGIRWRNILKHHNHLIILCV